MNWNFPIDILDNLTTHHALKWEILGTVKQFRIMADKYRILQFP